MMFAKANFSMFGTAWGDASFAASMAAVLLSLLGIAVAMSFFVFLHAIAVLLVLCIPAIGLLRITDYLPYRRRNRRS